MRCNYRISGRKLMKHRYSQQQGNKAIHSNKVQSHESGACRQVVSALSASGSPK